MPTVKSSSIVTSLAPLNKCFRFLYIIIPFCGLLHIALFLYSHYCNQMTHHQYAPPSDVAIFLRIYPSNTTEMSHLTDCINNVVIAKSKLNSTLIRSLALYVSFDSEVDHTHRTEMQRSLHLLSNDFDRFYIAGYADNGQTNQTRYDYVLKLNTLSFSKAQLHSIQCMCGTPSQVIAILNNFGKKSNVDLIAPHGLTISKSSSISNLYPLLSKEYTRKGLLSVPYSNGFIRKIQDLYSFLNKQSRWLSDSNLRTVAGGIYWMNWGSLKSKSFKTVAGAGEIFSLFETFANDSSPRFVVESLLPTIVIANGGQISEIIPAPKLLPLYFPQYHAIPENDRFWGKGFTEWSLLKDLNISDIYKPLPVAAGGLGYYNLLDPATRIAQEQLAKQAGIYGFVFYHYWFSGSNAPPDHKVMYKVPELLLSDGHPYLPFMFSWANEPWSKRWTGDGDQILLSQDYGDKLEWKDHYDYLHRFFRSKNYVKVNNKPVFIIYRIGHFGDKLQPMLKLWNHLAVSNGFAGMYFIATIGNFYNIDNSTALQLQNIHEIDATFHFWPNIKAIYNTKRLSSTEDVKFIPSLAQYWGSCTGFDARPRRPDSFSLKVTPKSFEANLQISFSSMKVERWRYIHHNFYFVMAWNEWNEQAILEPSDKHLFGYLHATRRALENLQLIET